MALDIKKLRKDFPILDQQVKGYPLAYLDNAASTQKPLQVIDAISNFYKKDYANVHRGVHELSQRATQAYENAREKIRNFINASSTEEIIFVRGTTEAINLTARSWGGKYLGQGDEVLISTMEHHSNIVPWKQICEEKGAVLKVIPLTDKGELDLPAYEILLNERTKLVGVVHLSNSLGTQNDVKMLAEMAHEKGALFLADGAQSAAHIKIDVKDLNIDFFTMSAHKMYGPTGIGALYVRKSILEEMPPYQSGGDMILSVSFDEVIYNDLPWRFEAGTPNISGAVGFAAAIDYICDIGLNDIARYEKTLLDYAEDKLKNLPGIHFIGEALEKASVLSFTIDGIHPHDLGTLLDDKGVAVRTGHHCTQPVMKHFGIPATTRASMVFYNTFDEIDQLHAGLKEAIRLFNG